MQDYFIYLILPLLLFVAAIIGGAFLSERSGTPISNSKEKSQHPAGT